MPPDMDAMNAPDQPLQCQVDRTPEFAVLRASGELDLATVSTFRSILADAAENSRHLLLDLSRVDYIDSSGIKVLIEVHALLATHGQRFVLIAPSETVRRIIDIISLDQVIPIFASVEGALSSL